MKELEILHHMPEHKREARFVPTRVGIDALAGDLNMGDAVASLHYFAALLSDSPKARRSKEVQGMGGQLARCLD